MSETVSSKDPGMIELGVLLADLFVELGSDDYRSFYDEFHRLRHEGMETGTIVSELLAFIRNNSEHPAYGKLKELEAMLHPRNSRETDPDVYSRATLYGPEETQAIREQMAEEVREAASVEPYRRSAPTISNEMELEDMDRFDRPTLAPGDVPEK